MFCLVLFFVDDENPLDEKVDNTAQKPTMMRSMRMCMYVHTLQKTKFSKKEKMKLDYCHIRKSSYDPFTLLKKRFFQKICISTSVCV